MKRQLVKETVINKRRLLFYRLENCLREGIKGRPRYWDIHRELRKHARTVSLSRLPLAHSHLRQLRGLLGRQCGAALGRETESAW